MRWSQSILRLQCCNAVREWASHWVARTLSVPLGAQHGPPCCKLGCWVGVPISQQRRNQRLGVDALSRVTVCGAEQAWNPGLLTHVGQCGASVFSSQSILVER